MQMKIVEAGYAAVISEQQTGFLVSSDDLGFHSVALTIEEATRSFKEAVAQWRQPPQGALSDWSNFFAWTPVRTANEGWVWLCRVWRYEAVTPAVYLLYLSQHDRFQHETSRVL